jgi:hypothetical protein
LRPGRVLPMMMAILSIGVSIVLFIGGPELERVAAEVQ